MAITASHPARRERRPLLGAERPGPATPLPVPGRRRRRSLPTHWPLTAALLGYPVWWLLGVATVVPILAAGVMAVQLARRRTLRTPPGFVLWTLFLVWVVLSATMLWVDAPTAVSGGAGPGRVAVFAYRLSWYAAATVTLLWVGNLTSAELPRRWIRTCLGWFFLITVGGGLLGVLAPTLDFPSLLELALPSGLRQNGFVSSLVHPGIADVETVLGRPEPRPKAPFDYTNTWGANFALTLPFFLVAWWRDGRRWQRLSTPVLLAVALVPMAYSLNRALWASLVMGVAGLVVLLALRGRRAPLAVTLATLVAVLLALLLTPLGSLFGDRLASPHSNERRGALLEQTVVSTATGSPVLGFGTTRDVQGNYSSISGGSTPDCDSCGVPPLGTQGQLWMVIFSQGLVGVGLFLAFLAVSLAMTWRARTTHEAICLYVLAAFGMQLLVYDTLGPSLLVVMIAIGLVWRDQQESAEAAGRTRPGSPVGDLVRRTRSQTRVLVGLTVVGTLIGATVALVDDRRDYSARISLMLVPSPVALPAAEPENDAARRATIDTEAALVVSSKTMARALGTRSAQAAEELRERISVTAPASTRVLTIEVRSSDPAVAERDVAAVVDAYRATRREYLRQRRRQAIVEVERLLAGPDTTLLAGIAAADTTGSVLTTGDAAAEARAALERLRGTTVQVGQVLRTTTAEPVSRQRQVPLVSGLALGLLVGSAVAAARSWRPRRASRPPARVHRTPSRPAGATR